MQLDIAHERILCFSNVLLRYFWRNYSLDVKGDGPTGLKGTSQVSIATTRAANAIMTPITSIEILLLLTSTLVFSRWRKGLHKAG